MAITIKAADLFCGAGGASTGLIRAVSAFGLDVDLLAVNHWPTAIDTHSLNHPGVKHLCATLEQVNPRDQVPGGRLNLLLAGPECTHHSTARGGKPIHDQSRATAWCVIKWAQELYIDAILIENVPEFRSWGPLGANGKPLKSRKGQTYQAFLNALRSLDYTVDDRVLCAADYGDPTTRQRLFIVARRGRSSKIAAFPQPTHSRKKFTTISGSRKKPWRAAREVIDWSIEGRSIFDPKRRPLRPNTLKRILAGLERFGGPELQPFLVVLRQHMAGRSIDAPLPTIAASGQHIGIAQPFLITPGGAKLRRARGVDEPVPTITGSDRFAVVEPYVLSQQSGGAPRRTSEPLPTVAADGAIGLAQAFIVDAAHGSENGTDHDRRAKSIDEPIGAVTGSNRFGLAQPVLVAMEHGGRAVDVDKPLPTVTTAKGGAFGVAQPFIQSYYGTLNISSVDDPVPTVTTKERFGLVQPIVEIDGTRYVLDIRFRMLQPHELAGAMSFPKTYVFTGNKEDQVKQIGNSWPGETAFALCRHLLEPYAGKGLLREERIA